MMRTQVDQALSAAATPRPGLAADLVGVNWARCGAPDRSHSAMTDCRTCGKPSGSRPPSCSMEICSAKLHSTTYADVCAWASCMGPVVSQPRACMGGQIPQTGHETRLIPMAMAGPGREGKGREGRCRSRPSRGTGQRGCGKKNGRTAEAISQVVKSCRDLASNSGIRFPSASPCVHVMLYGVWLYECGVVGGCVLVSVSEIVSMCVCTSGTDGQNSHSDQSTAREKEETSRKSCPIGHPQVAK